MKKILKDMSVELIHKHNATVFVYNQNDIKIVQNKIIFEISYSLKRRLNLYGIFVNGVYCGVDLNINMVGNKSAPGYSTKDLIGLSIYNYINGKYEDFKIISKFIGNSKELNRLNNIFKNSVCRDATFSNRDELTRLNLIIKNE